MSTTIDQLIPILDITEDCIISKHGDATMAFELFKPELFSLRGEELEAQHAAWIRSIGLLPNMTIVHLQDVYTAATWEADPEKQHSESFLSLQSDKHFNQRPYRQHRCYCYLTKQCGSHRLPTSARSSLIQRNLVPEFILDHKQLQAFANQCRQFMHLLAESSPIRYKPLKPGALMGSRTHTGLWEQYLQLQPPGKPPLLQDVELTKGVQIGKKHMLLYTLADAEQLPSQCSPAMRYERYSTEKTPFPIGFATCLGPLLDADHYYNQYLVIEDPVKSLKKLETLGRRLKSLGGHSPENAHTQETITQYLEQAAKATQRPIKAHFNVLTWTEDPEELPSLQNKVVTAMTRIGATAHLETIGAPQLWWAGLPGNAGDLPINETFQTFAEQAACFFIPESNSKDSPSPFGIRLGDRATGIPLHVDISDEPMRKGLTTNRNKFVLGGSGSGKSFFVNLMVRCYYEQGAHIVLVDIGGSYKGLCELLGGTYLAYSEQTPIQFNPFRLGEGESLDSEKKESLKALLLTLWKKTDEPYLRSEYVALSNMLEGYYAWLSENDEVFPCFDSFYEWLRDTHPGDGTREKEFDRQGFLYVLRPYYRGGEYDWLLNARDQPSLLQERLIVFELDAIKDHPILFPIVTIVIMEVFISKMRKLSGVRKVILLEEAWKAIAKEGMSDYVKYLFKTVRKFFGEAIVVTQDIEDMISSPVVKNTIINNADCKILLDQSKFLNRFDQIQELLGLTEKDKTMILSLNRANDPDKNYKEVFISLGAGHSRVYRTEVSLEEYLVYTTEEKQKVTVQDYSKRHGGIRKGVMALAADIRSGAVKLLLILAMAGAFLLLPNGRASAQVLDIIDEAVKAALEAADMKIQQAQTEVIYLQDAEKALENSMSGGLLDDITDWTQQERDLFSDYYQELWQVKTALSSFSRVGQLIERQEQLVHEYEQATAAIKQDPHFSAEELAEIERAYSNILNESIQNVQQLSLVIQSLATQMDDAGRLRTIDETAAGIDRNYAELQGFTQENTLLSLERARDEQEIQTIKSLYGIQ